MEEEIERYLDEMEKLEVDKPSRSCETILKIVKDVGFIVGGGIAIGVMTIVIWTFKFFGVEDDLKNDKSKF